MRVAMVSEHASPLAVLGGVDAGGQNVYVAALSQELGRRGVEVVVHTRRDDPDIPRRFELAPRVTVDHVDAGPPERIPNPIDTLLPFMDEFARDLRAQWERNRPDVVHSHFWMSGRAALAAAGPLGLPVVHTFHALGVVKRRHQGVKDTSPPERIPEERAIIARAERILATCSDEVFELVRLGADQRRISVVPCGVNLSLFRPDGPVAPRIHGLHRIVCVTRLVERKGVGNVVAALAEVPETELVIAGGPAPEELATDPEYRRLIELAGQVGVADHVAIGDGALVGAQGGVPGDLDAGGRYLGTPARPILEAKRIFAAETRLPELLQRVRALEREVEKLCGRPLGPRTVRDE